MLPEFTDQMHRKVRLEYQPKRIISIVPSQTELLYDLGLRDEVIGITKFCVHPDEWYQTKTRLGGTKQLAIEKILTLKPDLVIGNKEENTREDIELLEKNTTVWMSDISNIEEALSMIHHLGVVVGKEIQAAKLVGEIASAFESVNDLFQGKTVLYYIWNEPEMLVGKDTFIDSMLSRIGLVNVCKDVRYPTWDDEKIIEQPDYVFLSTEPYPFKENHLRRFQQKFTNSQVCLVDGEYFSWYGSRMRFAPTYFQGLFNQLTD